MLLEMHDVDLKQDKQTLIHNMNWQIKEGEHWAILGLNGAGKTTLLNLVCGYLYPTKGVIRVLGKTFGRYPLHELRKSIGWVSSSLTDKMKYHTDETGLEMILSGRFASIGLYDQPSESDISKASDILTQLDIDYLENRTFRKMSQGEKQRILIGRALMASPQLLILDEPCGGLDFLSKEKLLTTIEQMANKQETTIIYVTHHIDEILPIFEHTLLLKDGTPFSKGSTNEQLTSVNLSAFCQRPIAVNHQNGRFHLRIKNIEDIHERHA
ncbi:ABC transporter ATP-binding protein [Tuberibacillus sp. Marseille-P3662]|uniref:ABC transporter ATP-binding protein n=1 Tax=Tuberibacillus sp. Marseille-P3662 TaxID=1965358 RepID=UPI000A1C7B4E|nr:ABC transporter ATP-binding protein [Tuberibacillus sp. Marseille-P3662]